MFMEERQQQIADMIRQQGKVTIAEIVEQFSISDESARRDLRMLEKNGLCKRTRGGAMALHPVGMHPPVDRDYERMTIFDNYREIAKAAAQLIRPGECIYLTGGSLGYIIVPYLPRDFHYTLVINSVDVARALRGLDNVDVYLAGGKMRRSGSLVDSMAAEFLKRMHFDRCFLTGGGLTAEFGLSNVTDETATLQRTVIAGSRERILLMPSGKIGTDAFLKVCDADCFHRVITDWDVLEEQAAQLREMGIEVTVVERES